jgi:uncharacterized protein (DUF362 family)
VVHAGTTGRAAQPIRPRNVSPRSRIVSKEQISRAEFLKLMGAAALGVAFLPGAEELLDGVTGEGNVAAAAARDLPYISVAQGRSLNASHVAKITRTALTTLGGIGRFVHSGDDVIVKPNIGWAHAPKYATTTNPVVVATIVKEALRAGAKRVRVMDNPCGGGGAYSASGIKAAVERAGGRMQVMSGSRFRSYNIPKGRSIKSWRVYQDIMTCDVLIVKSHSTRVTIGCKNLMGCCDDMGGLHTALDQRIADITSLIRPDLTIVDGTRVRLRNGPSGTDLGGVRNRYMVIASADVVAADAYASRYLMNMGVGRIDLGRLSIKKVKL